MHETDLPPMSLDELDAFLLSERVPDDAMLLSELDGFVTAVVVGPVVIPTSEWLSRVWDAEAAVFDDEVERKRVVGAIFALYERIATVLDEAPEAFAPMFLQNPETGEIFAAYWAEGFLAGVALRLQAWRALLEADQAHLLAPMAAFLSEDDAGLIPLPRSDTDELRRDAPELVPLVVPALREFFRAREPERLHAGRPGRRDRCRCGSGRTCKGRCGAAAL
jgi:uncharacterized protein